MVGCCRGEVCGAWQGREFAYQIHDQPITALAQADRLLFSADLSGVVKMYDLRCRAISGHIYRFPKMLMSLEHSHHEHGFNLEGVCYGGQLETINVHRRSSHEFQVELPRKKLMGAVNWRDEWISLTEEGEIIRKMEVWADTTSKRGWCCLDVREGQLVAGSRSGGLLVIDFHP